MSESEFTTTEMDDFKCKNCQRVYGTSDDATLYVQINGFAAEISRTFELKCECGRWLKWREYSKNDCKKT